MSPLHHVHGCLSKCCWCVVQERLTAKEAMAHPYFAPVRQREGAA